MSSVAAGPGLGAERGRDDDRGERQHDEEPGAERKQQRGGVEA